MNRNTLLIAVSFGAVCLGMVAALAWGGALPGWLLSAELALLLAAALVYGFAAARPRLAPWLWSRPIRGTACVVLGLAAIFLPVQFVVAALFIAAGTRLVWASACDQAAGDALTVDLTIVTPATGIVPRAEAGRRTTVAAKESCHSAR